MRKLFGTDGMRGVANKYPMTAEIALNIGRATACLFKQRGHKTRIVIGKDTRVSGYMLENALVSGICSVGANALLIGPFPTPGVAFIITSMRADAGIVISASHNPFQDNGIKIFSGEGYKLQDSKELEIEKMVFSDNICTLYPSPEALGKAYRIDDARGRYIVFLKYTFPKEYTLEGMRVVLDCANGSAYRVAPETFSELGADVISIFAEPNGENINANCGSQYPKTLAKEVVKRRAHIGFAFDGDGDRAIAVDEKGSILTGDQILAICAKVMKEEGRLANNLVVSTVMSNMGLILALKKMGINHVAAKVGDRYVLEEMQKRGATLGGESSGHIIFPEHHTAGDGIITALQVLAAMKKEQKPISELAKIMKTFPQMLIDVEVKTKPEISEVPEISEIVRKVEDKLGGRGRVLVRYSGTESICRVMVEGPTMVETKRYCKEIANTIRERLN